MDSTQRARSEERPKLVFEFATDDKRQAFLTRLLIQLADDPRAQPRPLLKLAEKWGLS